MSFRRWFIGVNYALFAGSRAYDAKDMQNHPRNKKSKIADDNNNQPEQSVEDLAFVDLTCAGNDETENSRNSGVPC